MPRQPGARERTIAIHSGVVAVQVHSQVAALDDQLAGIVRGFSLSGADPSRIAVDVHLRYGAGGEPVGDQIALRYGPDGVYRQSAPIWSLALEGCEPGASPVLRADVVQSRLEPRFYESRVRLFTRLAAASVAPLADAALFHGCALARPDGSRAIAFLGASGSGKTTMRQRLPGWTALSDDCICLDVGPDGRPWVSGTAFAGSEGLPRRGDRLPLERVVLLEPRSPRLSLDPLGSGDLFEALMLRLFWFVADGPLVERSTSLLAALAERVPGWTLRSSLDHDIAPLVAEGGS